MSVKKREDPNAKDMFWVERLNKEQRHKEINESFLIKCTQLNSVSSELLPRDFGTTTQQLRPSKVLPKRDLFGHTVSLSNALENNIKLKGMDPFAREKNITQQNDYVPKGKRMYQKSKRMNYMDSNIDLQYKPQQRLRLGKFASEIVSKFNRRNYSIDQVKKGTFEHLQHPYQWNAPEKAKLKHSFIQEPKSVCKKVNHDSFDIKHYEENSKNNSPSLRGKDIAMRPKYGSNYNLSDSKYTSSKYFKNYSTLGTSQYDDIKIADYTSLHNPKAFDTTFMKFKIKRDVSPKVGQDANGLILNKAYSPMKN